MQPPPRSQWSVLPFRAPNNVEVSRTCSHGPSTVVLQWCCHFWFCCLRKNVWLMEQHFLPCGRIFVTRTLTKNFTWSIYLVADSLVFSMLQHNNLTYKVRANHSGCVQQFYSTPLFLRGNEPCQKDFVNIHVKW